MGNDMRKLLIANRGEIACRIQRSARALGWQTIALHTAADRDALHVQEADQACHIDHYLNIAALIDIAQQTGATAIHPGYGFLSERAELAQACQDAGILFVGPSASAIASMGSKSAAKLVMAGAGVPLIPGYHGDDQSEAALLQAAMDIGYPLMIKASAGGGGKGMRRVDQGDDFLAACAMARREAMAAFGDDRLLLEKLIDPARHIEVQILADQHGHILSLLDRDCSWQRRHQKVMEEAPAPGLPASLRQAMGEAARRAAAAVDYVGAGTLEFLVDQDFHFYFMEMNTRLQVEHPITEAILGIDLVAWQLRIACGETLSLRQEDLQARGHAIEVRLYAEDPCHDFRPSSGRIDHLQWPQQLRVDTGYRAGDSMSPLYDPMIGKLIVHAEQRELARQQLLAALERLQLDGIQHNGGFLHRLLSSSPCITASQHTALLESLSDLRQPAHALHDIPIAVLALLFSQLADRAHLSGPWQSLRHFRLHGPARLVRYMRSAAETVRVELTRDSDEGWHFQTPAGEGTLRIESRERGMRIFHDDGFSWLLQGRIAEDKVHLYHAGETWSLQALARAVDDDAAEDASLCSAPMNGRIVQVLVQAGEPVVKGQVLLHLEAMKMEQRILARADAVVARVLTSPGELVQAGQILLQWATPDPASGEPQ